MKVVILAGGLGTRISEESHLKPKPMIEIGEKPILWHIMKHYSSHGFNEFIICVGYKGFIIKEFFAHYFLHESDITFDFTANGECSIHNTQSLEPWKVTLVNTGLHTMTGGRIKRIQPYVGNETFMLTYGDGVSNVDIRDLLTFHQHHGKTATMLAVQPGGRFGCLDCTGDMVTSFREKAGQDAGLINGGFFVCEPQVFSYIEGDNTTFENEPLTRLAENKELMAYRHTGFWQCMDTMRDKNTLEDLWTTGNAPWKTW